MQSNEGPRITNNAESGDSQGRRLLILDDDASICTTVAKIAQKSGFDTHSTTDPVEFFSFLDLWKPTRVLIDLRMPEIDGISVLMRLAKDYTMLPVIIMSGLGSRVLESAARAATESGLTVIGVLAKPFTPIRLRNLLSPDILSYESQGIDGKAQLGERLVVSADNLKDALENEQINAWFQPKINCATYEVIGFEALARWNHPEFGIIKPDHFIAAAEQYGLIGAVSRHVFRSALSWYADTFPKRDKHLALNVSAKLLSEQDFPSWLIQLCTQLDVPPGCVILEITETSTMSDPLYMVQLLTQFRIKGFGLSIDDFGVGYSSLVQLARLPFSEIKIDKLFITTAATSAESQKIAAAIVGLTHALGMHATAEGVEDYWSLNFLRDIGCNAAQGYLFSEPLEGHAAKNWEKAYRPTDANFLKADSANFVKPG